MDPEIVNLYWQGSVHKHPGKNKNSSLRYIALRQSGYSVSTLHNRFRPGCRSLGGCRRDPTNETLSRQFQNQGSVETAQGNDPQVFLLVAAYPYSRWRFFERK